MSSKKMDVFDWEFIFFILFGLAGTWKLAKFRGNFAAYAEKALCKYLLFCCDLFLSLKVLEYMQRLILSVYFCTKFLNICEPVVSLCKIFQHKLVQGYAFIKRKIPNMCVPLIAIIKIKKFSLQLQNLIKI